MPISCIAHGYLTPALKWTLLPKTAKVAWIPMRALHSMDRLKDLNPSGLKDDL